MPYPPDYGGVFDLFYKIKYLHNLGIKIHLHCFEYGRGEQTELNQYCEQVYYYKRNTSILNLFLRLPYIVSSRKNVDLLHNLNKLDAAILLEGIHCTYYLHSDKIINKNVWVRLHNVEFEYYGRLAKSTKNILKKLYFYYESRRLKKYEAELSKKAKFLSVSIKDQHTYEEIFHVKNIQYLPVFLPFNTVDSLQGKGDYCLYHGNLSVPENEKAVQWLLQNVFPLLEILLVIAGKNPSTLLKRIISKNVKARLVENPSGQEMENLIQHAHIHLLPSFNSTGVKIKLLHALFKGRFVITNGPALEGTDLDTICTIATTPQQYKDSIRHLFEQPFTQIDIDKRKNVLKDQFNNIKNAQRLIELFNEAS